MHLFPDLDARPTRRRTVVRPTPAYVEIQTHAVAPAGISYTHVLAADAPGNFLIATCSGYELDRIRRPPDAGCPILRDLIAEGVNRRLDRGALVRLEDPDDGAPKWFIAAQVNGVNGERVRDPVDDPRLRAACDDVMAKSFAVREELAISPLAR